MLHWLQKELITSETADWIEECAQWAIDQFDAQDLWQQARLILPDATDFPERVEGPEPMARYVFGRVTEIAGVAHWPWQLVDARTADQVSQPPLLGLEPGNPLSSVDGLPVRHSQLPPLKVPFVIDQTAKPQDLVASLAHTCAQHRLFQSQLTPPRGQAYFEQAAEVLAVFSGFGIMLANSAYTYRGSCARCYNPRANRQASLSESESVYALALFCHLREQPSTTVFKHLKPYLKSSFKIATKQIKARATEAQAGKVAL